MKRWLWIVFLLFLWRKWPRCLRLRVPLQIFPSGEVYVEKFMTRLHVGYKRLLVAHPETFVGANAPVESPFWSSSDPDVLGIEVAPDNPLRVEVTGLAPGEATVNFTADAAIGAEVRNLFAEALFEVIPTEADHIDLEIGEEEPA